MGIFIKALEKRNLKINKEKTKTMALGKKKHVQELLSK